jgi:hypothetical protein
MKPPECIRGDESMPQGLKPASLLALNAKAEALAYLEATTERNAKAEALAY